jgi:hypothetical protein
MNVMNINIFRELGRFDSSVITRRIVRKRKKRSNEGKDIDKR